MRAGAISVGADTLDRNIRQQIRWAPMPWSVSGAGDACRRRSGRKSAPVEVDFSTFSLACLAYTSILLYQRRDYCVSSLANVVISACGDDAWPSELGGLNWALTRASLGLILQPHQLWRLRFPFPMVACPPKRLGHVSWRLSRATSSLRAV